MLQEHRADQAASLQAPGEIAVQQLYEVKDPCFVFHQASEWQACLSSSDDCSTSTVHSHPKGFAAGGDEDEWEDA